MILTLNLFPFIILISFIVALSFILVIKSKLSMRIKLAIPLIGTVLILTHLFWIIDVIGRPIPGLPKTEFIYISHRTVFIDDKGFTELWVKEKNVSTSRLHMFQKDEYINERLEKIRKEQKNNKESKKHAFNRDAEDGRLELAEVIQPHKKIKPNKPAIERINEPITHDGPF